ncbi:MAG TPA: aspartate-semialdehyde dehydrogenase [bacterium]|nr:aspartate-semialdehyde dehydrogenase [bacterium]
MRVLVMGATGLVGQELLAILEQRRFPLTDLVAVASAASAGRTLKACGRTLTVQGLDPGLFQPGDLVFFTGHDDLAAELVPRAVAAGSTVIDNSATFRMAPQVPLVIPEINGPEARRHAGLIANPNCTTATFILPLAPIHRNWGLQWATVASYQAISGAGRAPYEEFKADATAAIGRGIAALDPARLAFNLIPQIGGVGDDGVTSEERKMTLETRKMLGDPTIDLAGTAVRVPVLVGHACAVHLRTRDPLPPVEEVTATIADQPGVVLASLPNPVQAMGTDPVYVGRIRRFDDHTLGFFCVADNLRKGAALNAVQIAEYLLAHDALHPRPATTAADEPDRAAVS